MGYETGASVLDILISMVFDARFPLFLGLVCVIHWRWRLPKHMKTAKNKTVFITGCDTGMGHRMARRFDEMGMVVFAGCLQPEGEGAQSLRECCSGRLHIVPLDITQDDQVRRAAVYVKVNLAAEEKGLYCLINNAGVLAYADLDLMTPRMCEEVIAINLMGTIRVTKHFLPLIARTPGRIVTITSILARLAFPKCAVYTATKHALRGFFSCLRYEQGSRGIHIATVEPGDFSSTTDILQWMKRHLDEIWDNLTPEEQKSKLHLFEETKKRVSKTKCSPSEQERNFEYLLRDVEDAMLAQAPHCQYVSAPFLTKVVLRVMRALPEEWMGKLMARRFQPANNSESHVVSVY